MNNLAAADLNGVVPFVAADLAALTMKMHSAVPTPTADIFADPHTLPPYPYETIAGHTCEVLRATTPGPARGKVLLLHGILGGSEGLRSYMRPFAAHGFDVVAINYPYHGPNYCPRKVATVRAMDCVNAARAVLAELGEAVVVGKSFGGLVAQAIAHEPHVRASVLLASSPAPGVKFKADPWLVARLTPVIFELLFRKTFTYRYGFCRRYVYNNAENEAQARLWHETMTRESVYLVWDQVRYRVPVYPRQNKGPMLVTVGDSDPGLPPSVQRATADLWGADYREFAGFSHMLTHERGWETIFLSVMHWLDRNLENAAATRTAPPALEAMSVAAGAASAAPTDGTGAHLLQSPDA